MITTCLDFALDAEDSFCWHKQRKYFYEPRQQHKQLKAMTINEARPDIYIWRQRQMHQI